MLTRTLLVLPLLSAPAVAAQTVEVLPGSALVAGHRVAPGRSTRALYISRGGQERRLGTITESLALSADGTRLVREQRIDVMGRTRLDSAVVDRATLRPVHHSGSDGSQRLEVEFAGARISGAVTAKGARTPYDSTYAVPMFDSNFLEPLIGALPLAAGFTARLPIYIHERGGLVWTDVAVRGEELVTVGTATIACWKVDTTYLGVTTQLWIGRADGKLWKLVSEPSPGVTTRMEVEP